MIGGHLSGLSFTFSITTPRSTAMRGRLATVKTRRQNGRTLCVVIVGACLNAKPVNKNNNKLNGLGVKSTLASMLDDRVGSLVNGLGGTDLSINIRSRSSSRAKDGHASCDFHCSRHLFGGHFRVMVNNGISRNRGTAGSTRSFVSGVSLRCHLSEAKAQCVHLFCSGGCRDILRNRVARAKINVILHGGLSGLDRLFVFGGGGWM